MAEAKFPNYNGNFGLGKVPDAGSEGSGDASAARMEADMALNNAEKDVSKANGNGKKG